ncbi:hypothetical protein B0H14DRAFT_3526096 [Mycena olivaceomarginata]|nr:hypothetical protein B0H14DRAFT_3526096 [Mycena olivaceomarginata]
MDVEACTCPSPGWPADGDDAVVEEERMKYEELENCETDASKRLSVEQFFETYGDSDGRTSCWKLKGWPPSKDFRAAFPELYQDFGQAVPIPTYV